MTHIADRLVFAGPVPGTKKSIPGIRNAQKRADLIAYLRQATK
jgi:cytochrome c2